MELTFEKVGNQYVAEFQAPSDFNLHIEREEIGVLEVHQRGSEEGKYDFAWSAGINGRKVVDYDFGALVYPKWIKVISGSEVVSASVNFNEGGGLGSGSSSGDERVIYYKFEQDINPNFYFTSDNAIEGCIANVRATRDGINYMYSSVYGISGTYGQWSENPTCDAIAFIPNARHTDRDAHYWVIFKTYEELCEEYSDLPKATRITAEEYWSKFKSE